MGAFAVSAIECLPPKDQIVQDSSSEPTIKTESSIVHNADAMYQQRFIRGGLVLVGVGIVGYGTKNELTRKVLSSNKFWLAVVTCYLGTKLKKRLDRDSAIYKNE